MPCWHSFCKVLNMLESLFTNTTQNTQTERVLTYVKNERMGGYVPKYEIRPKQSDDSAQAIEVAMAGSQGQDVLSYKAQEDGQTSDQFGFRDLLDMVNPLHHVPVVGHVYRELTGDEIKPIARIVGGAAFSGPIGVASALIDTVVTEETGTSMAGNAYNLAFNREQETPAFQKNETLSTQSPEQSLEQALQTIDDPAVTSALLSYSNLGAKNEETLKYEAYQRAEEAIALSAFEEREPITTIGAIANNQRGGLYNL